MVKAELWHEIHSRFKLKESKKSIARSLGIDVRTVRKILRQSQPQRYRKQKKRKTLLSSYEDYIRKRLAAVGYCAQSIFEELREMGYKGGILFVALLNLFVRKLRVKPRFDLRHRLANSLRLTGARVGLTWEVGPARFIFL